MPLYTLEDLRFERLTCERERYAWEDVKPLTANAEEGLIYLFTQWLDLVSPSDFGKDEGPGEVLVNV
jgi:hypothetical protein